MRMKLPTKLLGKFGEWWAEWFYRLRGYIVVAKNARSTYGEIDLVLRRGRTLVIAEVKTRQSRTAGEGVDAVTRHKRDRLIRLGHRFAANHPDTQLRYDIISNFWTGWRFVVSHYADAFQPLVDAQRPWVLRG
ncbi:MAG: hypothetical protein DMF56_13015 [Acidobacteria bacterium]|nr:MAG: hypothetical protein DMF56_13015 [Acidobacteriota bacterium]